MRTGNSKKTVEYFTPTPEQFAESRAVLVQLRASSPVHRFSEVRGARYSKFFRVEVDKHTNLFCCHVPVCQYDYKTSTVSFVNV